MPDEGGHRPGAHLRAAAPEAFCRVETRGSARFHQDNGSQAPGRQLAHLLRGHADAEKAGRLWRDGQGCFADALYAAVSVPAPLAERILVLVQWILDRRRVRVAAAVLLACIEADQTRDLLASRPRGDRRLPGAQIGILWRLLGKRVQQAALRHRR